MKHALATVLALLVCLPALAQDEPDGVLFEVEDTREYRFNMGRSVILDEDAEDLTLSLRVESATPNRRPSFRLRVFEVNGNGERGRELRQFRVELDRDRPLVSGSLDLPAGRYTFAFDGSNAEFMIKLER